jgi:hypothetical protein
MNTAIFRWRAFLYLNIKRKYHAEKFTTALNIGIHDFSTDPIWPILTWCIFSEKVLKKNIVHLIKNSIQGNKVGILKL